MKLFLSLLFVTQLSWAYVPTVESLFRNGSNPDITGNVAILNFRVSKMDPSGMIQDTNAQNTENYQVYYAKFADDVYKLNQFKFSGNSFDEKNIVHQAYYPNYNAFSFANQPNAVDKSLFYGILNSLVIHDGAFLVSYLKSLGLPLRHNRELINREKIEYLAQYKQYLITINQDKEARKTLENPLRPADPAKKEKVDSVMKESMYVDTQQVKLAKDSGEMSWKVSVEGFDASVSYSKRYLQKITFKTEAGVLEFLFKDYGLVNASHVLPKQILVRDVNGDNYQIEIVNLRYGSITEGNYLKKLKEWDKTVREQSVEALRPGFLL